MGPVAALVRRMGHASILTQGRIETLATTLHYKPRIEHEQKLNRVIQPAFGWTNSHMHEFLEALANLSREEHDNYKIWSGGNFDPARFDIAAANRALAKLNN
jgi:hypothetical protein